MADAVATCTLCPRLCRHACPVASGTAREAAVPAVIASVLLRWSRGDVDDDLARQAATLCVDCGLCQDACHLHTPLPEALRAARATLAPADPPERPLHVTGTASVVAVLTDDRDWAPALARRLRHDVAWTVTGDALGAAARGGHGWDAHLDRVRDAFDGRAAVVADGGVADVLADAGVPYTWLHTLLDAAATPSCRCGSATCCGAAGPLAAHHPEDAARLAARFDTSGAPLADARCARHLGTSDVVDALMEDA